jgi:hypothetical protein
MVSGFHAKGTSREFVGIEIHPDPATGKVCSGSIVSVTPAPEPISKVSSWDLHMCIHIYFDGLFNRFFWGANYLCTLT